VSFLISARQKDTRRLCSFRKKPPDVVVLCEIPRLHDPVHVLSSGLPGDPDWHSLCIRDVVVTRFCGRTVVRALVVGLFVVSTIAPASAWMVPTTADECHGCCPEVIRAAQLPDCCIVAPEDATAPMPVRATPAPNAPSADIQHVAAWEQAVPVAPPVQTADPPLRSMPVLLRTTLLLI